MVIKKIIWFLVIYLSMYLVRVLSFGGDGIDIVKWSSINMV